MVPLLIRKEQNDLSDLSEFSICFASNAMMLSSHWFLINYRSKAHACPTSADLLYLFHHSIDDNLLFDLANSRFFVSVD